MSTMSGFSIYISCEFAIPAAAMVAQAVPFRKRPSETHSGPGLKTATDAVKSSVFSTSLAILSEVNL